MRGRHTIEKSEIKDLWGHLDLGESRSVTLTNIAQIAPSVADEDEYVYAVLIRDRVRSLCAEYSLYSPKLDQEGPVEDPVDFRKVSAPSGERSRHP